MMRLPSVRSMLFLFSLSLVMPCDWAKDAKAEEPIKQATLAELLKEYRQWELPLPPKGANLVRIAQNVPEESSSTFVWEIVEPRTGKPGTIFRSLQRRQLNSIRERFFPVPTPEAVLRHVKLDRLRGDFDYDDLNETELLLAIQCHHAGHDELARFFYLRCDQEPRHSLKDCLHKIAWAYWTSQLADRTSDRHAIAKVLKRFVKPHEGVEGGSALELVQVLERTLAPSTAKPGSIESMVDALVDYRRIDKTAESDPTWRYDRNPESRWEESKFDSWRLDYQYGEPEMYLRLDRLGFDAIAVLIEHIDDKRLTRQYVSLIWPGRYVPNDSSSYETVGQVARKLLEVYFHAEFPKKPSDYKPVKSDYEKIWNQLKDKNQWSYFAELVKTDRGGASVARKMNFLYKEKIIDLCRLIIHENKDSNLWTVKDCVLESEITKQEKAALLAKILDKMEGEDLLLLLPKLAQLDGVPFARKCRGLLARSANEIRRGVHSEFHTDLAAVVLVSEDQEMASMVVDLAKKMPVKERFILLTKKMNGRSYFVAKRNFYFLLGSFLDDQTVFDKPPVPT